MKSVNWSSSMRERAARRPLLESHWGRSARRAARPPPARVRCPGARRAVRARPATLSVCQGASAAPRALARRDTAERVRDAVRHGGFGRRRRTVARGPRSIDAIVLPGACIHYAPRWSGDNDRRRSPRPRASRAALSRRCPQAGFPVESAGKRRSGGRLCVSITQDARMTKPRTTHFDTLSLHAGARPDPATGARATPIYQTASFVFPDSDHAAALFNMERAGHVYSRISNPTCAVLEERIAALEGGVGAIATASGQAALHLAIVTLLGAGAHIVASRALYGGSHNLLDYTLPRFGDRDHVRRSARPRCLARGDPAGHAAPVRRDARQSRSRRARRSARRRARARARACRCSSTRRSPRRT